MVITVVKKLGAYIIVVIEKSPVKYRGVFVNWMQKDAIIKLKMLGYISMLAKKL